MKKSASMIKNTLKSISLLTLFFVVFLASNCTKQDTEPEPTIVSSDYHNQMLFIDQPSVQVITSKPATFKKISTNSNFNISTSGLISQTAINAINEIEATFEDGTKKNFFVMCASSAKDKVCYLKGWKNIERLFKTDTTRALVIRHAEAIVGTDGLTLPVSTNWWKSCDSNLARQLSENGKKQSEEYGKIFKAAKIPFKKIFTTEFCRAKQTAELMNLGLPITIDKRINGHFYNDSGMKSEIGMQKILEENSTLKGLFMITAHHDISLGTSQIGTYDMADSFIIKVGADKVSEYQGTISYPMWQVYHTISMK